MQISRGLFAHMVIQRAQPGGILSTLEGTTNATGTLYVRIRLSNSRRWGRSSRIGTARDGSFRGSLKGVTHGGPYVIELSIRAKNDLILDSIVVEDVLVGDVWVVAGQSNICGGGPSGQRLTSNPSVRAFYMNDTWRVAQDPIWHAFECVDEVHKTLYGGLPSASAAPVSPGLAITFAKELHRLSGVPQGLIASAHPGTSLSQWSPTLKAQQGASLYGAMLRRIVKNGGRISGLLWYQGEGDAGPDTSRAYGARMEQLISQFRADVNLPTLPVIMAQIGRVVGPEFSDKHWSRIREEQRLLPLRVPHVTLVPTIDLPLGDLIHLDGHAQQRLGKRMAALAPSMVLKKVTPVVSYINADVHVEFEHVVKGLRSEGRASGFSVLDAEGHDRVIAIELKGARAIIKTTLDGETIKSAALYYGYGRNPYCNVMDGEGKALPAFGPVTIPGPRAMTPFVTALRVSQVIRIRNWSRLRYGPITRLDLATRTFEGTFCNVKEELLMADSDHGVIFFVCDIRCSTAMTLSLLLGYDGPIRIWFDKKPIHDDPNGHCPARPDSVRVPVRASSGRHEILAALGSAQRTAWGLYLRIERVDQAGRQAGQLPEVLG